jgi:hypothetical protein
MLLSFTIWIQSTALFTAIRQDWFYYPIIMALHLIGISAFGGMILMTDLRLLGLAMRGRSVSDVVNQLRIPKRIGFVFVATCGILMLGSKAEEYYYNAFVRTKLTLLVLVVVHALVFRPGVYNNTEEIDRALRIPARAKLAAGLSLLLWIGVACAGRGIGYIEPPLDKIHAYGPTATVVTQRRP